MDVSRRINPDIAAGKNRSDQLHMSIRQRAFRAKINVKNIAVETGLKCFNEPRQFRHRGCRAKNVNEIDVALFQPIVI